MEEKRQGATTTIATAPNRSSKGIKIQQIRKVIQYFSNHIGTMLMCSYATGIERASICRYIRDVEKKGCDLMRIEKSICPISKHRATFFTIQSSHQTKY